MRLLVLWSVLCCCGVSLSAQLPSWRDHLEDLGAPSFETRAEASDALLADASLTLGQLERMYDAAGGVEQRQRLLTIAWHHAIAAERQRVFNRRGHGSLGVIHRIGDDAANAEAPTGARILRVLPGFPAMGVLRPGDEILRVDGRPLPRAHGPAALEQLISSHAAGDKVRLEIQRGDETLQTAVTLAGGVALSSMYSPETFALQPRYRTAVLDRLPPRLAQAM